MTAKRFDPKKELTPIPFNESICLRALEMKTSGLVWRPHVGCFVWDPDKYIKPDSPFPDRIYFILSMARFIEIFDTTEQITNKLVWLPTWYQARIVCQQLGVSDDAIDAIRQRDLPVEELFYIYGLIVEVLKQGKPIQFVSG